MQRSIRFASIATPCIAVGLWLAAYVIAAGHLDRPPCCAQRMAVAPLATMLLALPTLIVAAWIGRPSPTEQRDATPPIWRPVAATVITWICASWMFLARPRQLASGQAATDTWPFTADSIGALAVGLVLSVLPWTVALAITANGMRARWWPEPSVLPVGLGPGVHEGARE